MNKLTPAKRVAVISALVEGVSVRGTVRLTGVSKGAVLRLLAEVGTACAAYMDRTLRNLPSKRVQCDEIWSFCGAKRNTVKKDPSILERNPDAGDVWTWVAIDADTKLCVSYLVGDRNLPTAKAFMRDVASRLANRVQLTTDAYGMYLSAVDTAFNTDIDYAQLHKIYAGGNDGRFSPPACIGCNKIEVSGSPDPDHISTSYVERQNLTMRMQNAPVYAAHERVQQEAPEPCVFGLAVLHALQLLPRASDAPRHAGNGSGTDDNAVDDCGHRSHR
jgi:hypothetical protein